MAEHYIDQSLFGQANRWNIEQGLYVPGEKVIMNFEHNFENHWLKNGGAPEELFLTSEYQDWEKKLINYYYDNLHKSDGDIEGTMRKFNDFVSTNYTRQSELILRSFEDRDLFNSLNTYYNYKNPSVQENTQQSLDIFGEKTQEHIKRK